ncbi:MAG: molybdate ABC transporter substrate-binding protein [Candidatus Sericytochromatia bacterium]
MKKIIISILPLITFLLISSKAYSENNTITVATSANVQYVMNELKEEFKKESGIEVKPIINSSGKLVTQIKNNAPFDIFMSADMDYPNNLYKSGFSEKKPEIYAYGKLVLWTMKEFNLSSGIKILTDNKVEKIALANPITAPYGKEAINSLNFYRIKENLKNKIIFAESIAQVNNYIFAKAVDIGFTSKSTVISPEMKNKGKWVEIDPKTYSPIAQSIIILNYGKKNNNQKSQKFYNFIFSKKGQKIFEKYGYAQK